MSVDSIAGYVFCQVGCSICWKVLFCGKMSYSTTVPLLVLCSSKKRSRYVGVHGSRISKIIVVEEKTMEGIILKQGLKGLPTNRKKERRNTKTNTLHIEYLRRVKISKMNRETRRHLFQV